MFQQIKENVSILDVLPDLLGADLVEAGTDTFQLDTAECPHCGHSDCYKIKASEDENEESFYHCFSCGAHGDVITAWAYWDPQNPGEPREEELSPGVAARELAKKFGIKIETNYSPVQEIFDVAARYYHNLLMDPATKEYAELRDIDGNSRTPLNYQIDHRGHTQVVIEKMVVGWSDGKLHAYLDSLGYDGDLIKESGLINSKGYDFLPAKTFIYPHFVSGRVSHFTFKDPLKIKAYQIPNKSKLNGHMVYNQDSIKKADTVVIVEGENDTISTIETGNDFGVIGTIGNISKAQFEWMKQVLVNKEVITFFDNDEAGDKYRSMFAKLVGPYIKRYKQCKTTEVKDIDEYLQNGGEFSEIADSTPWSKTDEQVAGYEDSLGSSGEGSENDPEVQSDPDDKVFVRGGCYFKTVYKDGNAFDKCISNFVIQPKCTFIFEGRRLREVVIRRKDGFTSDPITISSEDKVSLRGFKVLIADAADATFYGTEMDFTDMWEVIDKVGTKVVWVAPQVGRMSPEFGGGWMFGDCYITTTGLVVEPDQNGVMWINPSKGVRPLSIRSETLDMNSSEAIPRIKSELDLTAIGEIEKEFALNMAKNLGGPGKALTMLAWAKATLNGTDVFKSKGFFPFLYTFGRYGKGKTVIQRYLLSLFDLSEYSYQTAPNLRSGVGFSRIINYYSDLPVILDEIRNDKVAEEISGSLRAWYNRAGLNMGNNNNKFSISSRNIRSCIGLGGEEVIGDLATMSRCVLVHVGKNERELQESFEVLERINPSLHNVGYKWCLEAAAFEIDKFLAEYKAFYNKLSERCSSTRTVANYAIIGVFGQPLVDKYFPDFDWVEFLANRADEGSAEMHEESPLNHFWQMVEGIQAKDAYVEGQRKLTPEHITTERDFLYIWVHDLHRVVAREVPKEDLPFGYRTLLDSLREEDYFIKEDRLALGTAGSRRRVVVLDLKKCPETLNNIAKVASQQAGV